MCNLDTRTWVDIGKRRRWFETYAKAHNFDPLVSNNWLNTTIDDPSVRIYNVYFKNS